MRLINTANSKPYGLIIRKTVMLHTVRKHISHLVGFPSISADSNIPIAKYCQGVLETAGFTCHLVYNAEKTKVHILAVGGNIHAQGIMFSAHMDVVPVVGQDWTYPPFELTDTGDKWYGRGTTDMKGYIALLLSYADALVSYAEKTGTPIYICLSYDEEVGCQGIPFLIQQLPHLMPVKPAYCFVGEPTNMRPVLGHKGKSACEVSVRGKSCHSAQCQGGINAIEIASQIIVYIRMCMDDCIKNAVQDAVQDDVSSPPHATLQTGVIQGGMALNIVPESCVFQFEIRSAYQQEIDTLYDNIIQYIDTIKSTYKTDIIVRNISRYPPLNTDNNSPIKSLADDLCGYPNTPPCKVSFGTEGGIFAEYGIPTIILGVGDMAQGHTPDEYIQVSQIQQGIQFFEKLTKQGV